MHSRLIQHRSLDELTDSATVALIGPHQCGKTALALELYRGRPPVDPDHESDRDRAKPAQAGAHALYQRYETDPIPEPYPPHTCRATRCMLPPITLAAS